MRSQSPVVKVENIVGEDASQFLDFVPQCSNLFLKLPNPVVVCLAAAAEFRHSTVVGGHDRNNRNYDEKTDWNEQRKNFSHDCLVHKEYRNLVVEVAGHD